MTQPYLITFTPVGPFFFGTERSFYEGYFAVSSLFPSSLTVLGCLRHSILRSNGITVTYGSFPTQTADVKKLSGLVAHDFFGNGDPDFGVIERLSPVFLVRQGHAHKDIYFPLPADIEMAGGKLRLFSFSPAAKGALGVTDALHGPHGERSAIRSTKDRKSAPARCFGGAQFWSEYLGKEGRFTQESCVNQRCVFCDDLSYGIALEGRQIRKGQFYCKSDYRLESGWAFGVVAWLKDSLSLKNQMVMLGGRTSLFQLSVQTIVPDDYERHPVMKRLLEGKSDASTVLGAARCCSKVILLSPLHFDKALLKNGLRHAVVERPKIVRYFGSEGRNPGAKKTACLVPEGSVFYPAGPVRIADSKTLTAIGYNQVVAVR
jgi:CRISPR type III-B/RAMP module-associated protein Cmr3